MKLLAKIDDFLSMDSYPVTCYDCASLHGSLQHLTFIYKEGHSTLPPISYFTSKFPNDFPQCHVLTTVVDSVRWWNVVLYPQVVPILYPRVIKWTQMSGSMHLHHGELGLSLVSTGPLGIFERVGKLAIEILGGQIPWLWNWQSCG